jgi:hypothetical protein
MIRGQEDKRTRGRDENQTKKITVDLMWIEPATPATSTTSTTHLRNNEPNRDGRGEKVW